MAFPPDSHSGRTARSKRQRSGEVRRRRGRPPGDSQHREDAWPKGLYRKGPRGGDGPFFFERNHRGVPYWFALGDTLSRAIEDAEYVNYCLREDRPIDRLHNRNGVSHVQFLDFAYNEIETTVMPKRTRNKKRSVLQLWQDYRAEHYPDAKALRDITPGMAQDFVNWRLRQPVTRNGTKNPDAVRKPISPKTVKVEMQVFRPLWDAAVKRRWITANPFREIKLPRVDYTRSKGKLIPEDQVELILAAARRFDATPEPKGRPSGYRGMMEDAIRLLLETGLRRGELRMLPWSRVQLTQEVISIERDTLVVPVRIPLRRDAQDRLESLTKRRATAKTLFPDERTLAAIVPSRAIKQASEALLQLSPSQWQPGSDHITVSLVYEWQPKGMEAPIPLSSTATAILKKRRKVVMGTSPFVFPHPDGGPLRSDFWQRFQTVCRAAEIKDHYRPHDLRHSFGRNLRRAGAPLHLIQQLMRHTEQRDTEIYAPYQIEEGRAWLKRAEQVRNQGRRARSRLPKP